jgi:predicted small secreted protein
MTMCEGRFAVLMRSRFVVMLVSAASIAAYAACNTWGP